MRAFKVGAAVMVALALIACEPREKQKREIAAQKEKADREEAERQAKYKAQRVAEQSLMSDSAQAIPEIERRLSTWVRATEGFLLIKSPERWNKSKQVALSASTPWFVSCGSGGLEITLGSWIDVEWDGEHGNAWGKFSTELTTARLTPEQCAPLMIAAMKRMGQIAAHQSGQ